MFEYTIYFNSVIKLLTIRSRENIINDWVDSACTYISITTFEHTELLLNKDKILFIKQNVITDDYKETI